MSQTPPSFHIRLPQDLKGKLETAAKSSGNSLNREMVDRLERTFDPDSAMELADTLRPFLDKLTDDQRREAIEAASRILSLSLLVKTPRKRRS